MFNNNDFMNYAGYRYTVTEDKVEQCLAAARRGEKSISIDADDLTDDEEDYIQNEVRRRIESGNY